MIFDTIERRKKRFIRNKYPNMKKIIFISILLIFNTLAHSQKKATDLGNAEMEQLTQLETQISELAKKLVNDTLVAERLAAQEKILPLVKQALSVPNSFNYAFDKLENISVQTPNDRSFRIFTWQLFIDQGNYKYFGFIQPNRSKSTFYELKDNAKDIQKPETQLLTADKWFGCLYYNIKQFKTKDGEKYLLFGYNAHDTIEKIKLVDVLNMKGGAPKFGSNQAFEIKEYGKPKKVNRLLFYHSYDASMRLNFDEEMNMIVHDHLEDIASRDPSVPTVGVPDGTYEAFKLEKGVWVHIDKLANTEMDEAPRPKPVIGRTKMVNKEDVNKIEWPDEVKKKQ